MYMIYNGGTDDFKSEVLNLNSKRVWWKKDLERNGKIRCRVLDSEAEMIKVRQVFRWNEKSGERSRMIEFASKTGIAKLR